MSETRELSITGMSCTSCALNVERALKFVPGVTAVRVSFTDKRAIVSYDRGETDPALFEKRIKAAGYGIAVSGRSEEPETGRLEGEKKRLILAWVLTIPLTLKMLGEMLFGFFPFGPQMALFIDLVIAFPVIN